MKVEITFTETRMYIKEVEVSDDELRLISESFTNAHDEDTLRAAERDVYNRYFTPADEPSIFTSVVIDDELPESR